MRTEEAGSSPRIGEIAACTGGRDVMFFGKAMGEAQVFSALIFSLHYRTLWRARPFCLSVSFPAGLLSASAQSRSIAIFDGNTGDTGERDP